MGYQKKIKGVETSPRNCYANPFDWKTCTFTALGCYFCLMDKIFDDGITNTYFFKKDGAKQGILSHRYCTYLSNLFEEITTIIYKYISTRKSGVVLHHFDNRGAGQYKNFSISLL